MSEPRRFPPPWTVRQTAGEHFAVVDANGLALAFVYVQDTRAGAGFAGLTEDEARRIAASIAKLPQVLGKDQLSLAAILADLERLRDEAAAMDEPLLAYLIDMAVQEAVGKERATPTPQ